MAAKKGCGSAKKKHYSEKGSDGSAHGSVYRGGIPKLTVREKEIYHLWAEEFQTPLQIACRRRISDRAVRKHILSIKKKGFSLNMVPGVPKNDPTSELSEPIYGKQMPKIRLHGQHFVLRLLGRNSSYDFMRSRGNIQYVMDCTVKLHKDSIEVYASPGLSFFGSTADKATAESMEFWSRTFHKLETQLGIVLLKPRAQNIRQVSAHYARINCGLAKEAIDAGDRVRLFAREDGKLWFTIDNSFNLNESETLHPETAQRDMADVVEPHLNDWRAHPGMMAQSELQRVLTEILVTQQTTVASVLAISQSLQVITKYLESQVPKPPECEEVTRVDYIG